MPAAFTVLTDTSLRFDNLFSTLHANSLFTPRLLFSQYSRVRFEQALARYIKFTSHKTFTNIKKKVINNIAWSWQAYDNLTSVWQFDGRMTIWWAYDNLTSVWQFDRRMTIWRVYDNLIGVWQYDECMTQYCWCLPWSLYRDRSVSESQWPSWRLWIRRETYYQLHIIISQQNHPRIGKKTHHYFWCNKLF